MPDDRNADVPLPPQRLPNGQFAKGHKQLGHRPKNVANKLTTAAHAVFLQAAAPLYLVLLGPWLLAERVHTRDVPFLAWGAIVFGLVLYTVGQTQLRRFGPRNRQDEALGQAIRGLDERYHWCAGRSQRQRRTRDERRKPRLRGRRQCSGRSCSATGPC